MDGFPFEDIAREAAEAAKRRAKGDKPIRELAALWSDDYVPSVSSGGVVDGLLPSTGMTVLYGESGCGKTFTAIDMACHVAAGRPWRGMEVEQGIVVYVAAEAPESVKRRLWAWKRHHGVERLPVLVVQSSVDLLNGDADAVAALVEAVAREHGRVALVVVDTLARAMTGNENAPDDMGKFVGACGRIREAGETHVLVVHHSGKDQARGARGHSCLRAATDVELEVTRTGTGGAIKVTKSRDDESGHSFGFALATVELGPNGKGRMVSTCVAVEGEMPEKPAAKGPKLTGKQRLALQSLSTAIVDHGQAPPPAADIPLKVRAARFERWEEINNRHTKGAEDDGKPACGGGSTSNGSSTRCRTRGWSGASTDGAGCPTRAPKPPRSSAPTPSRGARREHPLKPLKPSL